MSNYHCRLEINHAYQEIEKELGNSEIKLVSPSVVRVIQGGGEINEDLKQAKIIFFPINNSESHETADTGSHWTLLVCDNRARVGAFSHYNSAGPAVPNSAKKVAENFCQKLGTDQEYLPPAIYNDHDFPQQTNSADCGVYVIAFTRALAKRSQKGNYNAGLKAEDLIFSIAEERQKLKAAGFPKKGSPGKDYDIGDDVAYTEEEENQQLFDLATSPDKAANNFKEFSKKVRLLSGKSLTKDKLQKVYRLKKILKACSLLSEELKKTKSFAGENNFGDKLTATEKNFIKQNINKETVEEINNLYNLYFPGE
ncbi:16472_t:CDS:2 [Entrophospora sp. SA101]|nr:16472_t:CDS:2 [Entrophospora sp. SA101]